MSGRRYLKIISDGMQDCPSLLRTVFFSFVPLHVCEQASLSLPGLSWVIVLRPAETGRAVLLYEERARLTVRSGECDHLNGSVSIAHSNLCRPLFSGILVRPHFCRRASRPHSLPRFIMYTTALTTNDSPFRSLSGQFTARPCLLSVSKNRGELSPGVTFTWVYAGVCALSRKSLHVGRGQPRFTTPENAKSYPLSGHFIGCSCVIDCNAIRCNNSAMNSTFTAVSLGPDQYVFFRAETDTYENGSLFSLLQ